MRRRHEGDIATEDDAGAQDAELGVGLASRTSGGNGARPGQIGGLVGGFG